MLCILLINPNLHMARLKTQLLTGVGPIHQLSLETGFGPTTLFAGLLLLLSTNLVGGLSPLSKTFTDENQRDVNSRAVDGGLNPNPRKFFAEAEVRLCALVICIVGQHVASHQHSLPMFFAPPHAG
jgi:hypothetical protein